MRPDRRKRWALLLLPALLSSSLPSLADPWAAPGDARLRHDLQLLADAGILKAPLATWPVSWGQVARDLESLDLDDVVLSASVSGAFARVQTAAAEAGRTGNWRAHARLAMAAEPVTLRTFAESPREEGEIEGGVQFTGERLAIRLQATVVGNPLDDQQVRADGSYVGMVLGNWMLSAGLIDRWWGPGWNGSLILASNARPVPAIAVERNFADSFETRWLSWIGPWRISTFMGRMEGDRDDVEHPLLWGLRFTMRPAESLEIGFTRTAQWCGEGRPCGLDTFWDLLIGNDNRGGDGVDPENEPGNQLAGFDLRWSLSDWLPAALYAQGIGEDEAGFFPSKYLGLLGFETWGQAHRGSWRAHLEYADTACDFLNTAPQYGCAYEHSIYTDGYRYRGRAIGHAIDRDGRSLSLGGLIVDSRGRTWSVLLRSVELNRESIQGAHSLTPVATDLANVELSHERSFRFGTLRVGIGYDAADEVEGSPVESGARGFLEWRGGI